MGRGRQSHDKRQREKAKQAKQAAKREERAERARQKAEGGDEELDEAALHEQFRILNERKAAGEITEEEFEAEREEIWEKLGLVIQ